MKNLAIAFGAVLVGTGALWASLTAPLPLNRPLSFRPFLAELIRVEKPLIHVPQGLDALVHVHRVVAAQA